MSGKALAREKPAKDGNGQLIHGKEDQIARWRDHFCSALNHVLVGDESMILCRIF